MNKMKVCIAIMFLATSTVAFRMHPDMQKNVEECAKETKVDISVFKPGEKPDMKIFENKDYQCFAKCLAVKFGLVDEDGVPNMDNIKKIFNPSEGALEKIQQCVAANQQEDKCEKVFKTHECVIRSAKA